MLFVLILAGGVGSRLWPKSRNSLPKQFLNITGTETLIQTTVRRVMPLVPPERIFVATREQYVPLVEAQLPMLPKTNIIAEISGKNTAPAIGLGALHIAQIGPEDTMAVLTSDHLIPDEDAFRQALQVAVNIAETGKLVTLGITPTGPETGFGYIHRGEVFGDHQGLTAYGVNKFLEKPDLERAQQFFESGEYYWNSGMFIWQVPTLFAALQQYMPMLAAQLADLNVALFQPDAAESVANIWARIESESIDFGLMEKADEVAVVPLNAGWNDVGNWTALYNELAQNPGDNVVVGADHLSIKSKGILVQGTGKLIATIGLENIAIVETEDAILVCALDQTQNVKKVVDQLKAAQKGDYL